MIWKRLSENRARGVDCVRAERELVARGQIKCWLCEGWVRVGCVQAGQREREVCFVWWAARERTIERKRTACESRTRENKRTRGNCLRAEQGKTVCEKISSRENERPRGKNCLREQHEREWVNACELLVRAARERMSARMSERDKTVFENRTRGNCLREQHEREREWVNASELLARAAREETSERDKNFFWEQH